jgi:hypothetical protein
MVTMKDARGMRIVYEDVKSSRNCLSCDLYATYPTRAIHDAWVHKPLVDEDPRTTIFDLTNRPHSYIFPIGLFNEPRQWAGQPVQVLHPTGLGQGPLRYIPRDVLEDAKDGRVLFVLDQSQEGNSDPNLWEWFYDHAEFYGVSPRSLLYLTSDHFAEYRHGAYCDANGIHIRINVISSVFNQHTWPRDCMLRGETGPNYDTAMAQRTQGKTYLYNCLNRMPHAHRRWMFAELLQRDLLVDSRFSMPVFEDIPPTPDGTVYDDELVNRALSMLPLVVDRHDFHVNMYNHINHDIYLDSWFSVVTETFTDSKQMLIGEKVFKPMWCSSPFMVVSTAGTMRRLRELGYRTFPMLWDESYDDMPCVMDRIRAIADQVENVSRIADKVGWIQQAEEALRHNHRLLHASWIDGRDHKRMIDIWHGFTV